MYFLLADLIHRFVYLKTGLAAVLVWVGVKMLLHLVDVKVPTLVSLGVVATLVTTSVVLSLRATRDTGRTTPPTPPTPSTTSDRSS
jgi:tellurite resistance protein TerC